MKGKWKRTLAVFCAFFTLGAGMALTACDTEVASIRGADGKDGKDLTVYDLYTEVYEKGIFTGTYEEYLASLNVEVNENNDTTTIAKNLMSTVSIVCGFKKAAGLQTAVSASAGAGVIVDLDKESGDAYIVTNYHVMYETSDATDNADGISTDAYVYLYGARVGFTKGDSNGDGYLDFGAQMTDLYDGIKATYVGGAMDYDIALLKVENSEYLKNSVAEEATIGDSDVVELGEKAFVIGNPQSDGIAVTDGVISKDSETISLQKLDGTSGSFNVRVMRTSAAINSGNSGGGLYNADGELIGIVNAKNIQEETDNIGYALPISMVKNLLHNIYDCATSEQLRFKGAYAAKLGIVTFPTASTAAYVDGKLTIVQEVSVDSVIESGCAASGKLKEGDIIKAFALKKDGSDEIGEFFTIWRDFQIGDWLLQVRWGDTVIVRVERGGVTQDVEVEYNVLSYFTACS